MGAAIAAGCGSAPSAPPSLQSDFDTDPRQAGWVYICVSDDDTPAVPSGEWTRPTDTGEAGCLVARTGYWESPSFTVSPMKYYRADCRMHADGPGYFWVNYRDDKDLSIPGDNCMEFDTSAEVAGHSECFRAPMRAATATVQFHAQGNEPMRVESIRIREVTSAGVADWIDSQGEAVGRVEYVAPAERLALLSRAMEKLRSGGRLRIVMLGDSIMNDSSNSLYETRLERLYPGSQIEVVTSVRGGAGCWLYKTAMEEWVLRHCPDLLMIGGISQRGDIESIREVVEKTRAGCDTEVVLLSGPAGSEGDPAASPDWESHVSLASTSDGYHAQLKRLAEELRCEFIDLATAWGLHMQSFGKPYEYFMRDSIHANTRGKQVIGAILAAHFAPAR